jgi:flagellar basal body P-ring protein FlgI
MAYKFLSFTCAATANTFYVPVPYDCKLHGASWVANTDPSTNKTVVISKNGGNTIISGNISTTPGTVVAGTMTATVADQKQVMTTTYALKLVITVTAALQLGIWLDLDEFKTTPTP